jgi:hypothetical protein
MKAFRNQIDYFLNGNEPVLVHNITVNTTTLQTVQLLCRSKHEVDLTVNVVFNEIDAINIVTKRGIIFSESQYLDFHRNCF